MKTNPIHESPLQETDPRLDELLLEWEDAQATGQLITAAEICRDCPELTTALEREIQRLRAVDRFIFPRKDSADNPRQLPQIPGYEILRELGRGGMSIVYLAKQLSLGRLVAVKTLALERLGHNDFVVRMRQEAEAMSRMNHPHIVQVYDVIETPSAVSMVLEYIDGQTLAQMLNGTPMPPREAARIALILAQTLSGVHAQGLLHRDIKPANVLIDATGQIKLTDFGLVKSDRINQGVTLAGELIGSPHYMAPEQAEGRAADVDARTDIYGLGTTLYEMISGRPPFIGASTMDVLDQVRNREAVALRQLISEMPRDLETICHKCLEKKPNRRFSSALELSEELNRFLQGTPIQSRPIGSIDRGWRWCRRHPAFAGLTALSLLASLLIVALLGLNYRNMSRFNSHLKELNDQLVETAQYALHLRKIAEIREDEAQRSLYVADIARAATAWKQSDTMELMDLLGRHIPKVGETDQRGFEWWFLRRQSSHSRRILVDIGAPIYQVGSSLDSKYLFCAGRDAIVRFFDPETGKILQEFATNQQEVNGVTFSPDGREIATTGDDGTIRFFDIATGTERLNLKSQSAKSYQTVYLPEGQQILSCGTDSIIRAFDVNTGEELFQLTGHTRTVESLALIDSGQTLISTSDDNTVRIWDLPHRKQTRSLISEGDAGPVIVLPDRRLLIVGCITGLIQIFHLESGEELASARHLDRIGALAMHPSGTMLAAGDASGQIRLRKIDTQGEFAKVSYQPWQAHTGSVYSLAWSADGSRIISSGDDGRVISWNLIDLQPSGPKEFSIDRSANFQLIPKTSLLLAWSGVSNKSTIWDWKKARGHTAPWSDPGQIMAISRDGRYVAALADDETLQVFQTSGSGEEIDGISLVATANSRRRLKSVQFAPDSKSLAVIGPFNDPLGSPDEDTIWLLDMPDLSERYRIPLIDVKNVAFSPGGAKLAVSMRSGLACWDLRKRELLWKEPLADAEFVEFSPDGKHIAATGLNRALVVRKADSGDTELHMSNHRAPILAMAYSPDGRLIASSASDGSIKVWNAARGQELIEFRVEGRVRQLKFSEQGAHLICQLHSDDQPNLDTILVFDGTPFPLR